MKNYTVKLNGKSVPVYDARVSAMPFNKVWDGAQRSKSQTEIAYFVSVDIDKPSCLEIELNSEFKNYEIRPLEFNLECVRTANKISVNIDKPMQFTFEPNDFHEALHVFVNSGQERPYLSDGNVIYYGPGEHTAGIIWVKSGQTVYIDEGAVVHGMIYAKDASDFKILGRGILDSSRYHRANDPRNDGTVADTLRKNGVCENFAETGPIYSNMVLYNCKNAVVEGIVLRDAMFWSVIIRNGCENITLDNIKIIGQWRYNSDGIDVCASKNIIVKNSFIRSFDDCFVVRGPYLPDETQNVENVAIENCVLWCDWGKAFEVWCGDKPGTIRNVSHKNNYIIHLSMIAMSVTAWFGSVDTVAENLSYENIFIDGEEKYLYPGIESDKNPRYEFKYGYVPFILRIYSEKIGKNLGNQQFEPVQNTDEFNLYFRNISFRNVHYRGIPLRQEIKEKENLLYIDNVSAVECDFSV